MDKQEPVEMTVKISNKHNHVLIVEWGYAYLFNLDVRVLYYNKKYQ